jgi:hypothetical protein
MGKKITPEKFIEIAIGLFVFESVAFVACEIGAIIASGRLQWILFGVGMFLCCNAMGAAFAVRDVANDDDDFIDDD